MSTEWESAVVKASRAEGKDVFVKDSRGVERMLSSTPVFILGDDQTVTVWPESYCFVNRTVTLKDRGGNSFEAKPIVNPFPQIPLVGVGAIVWNDDRTKILLGHRIAGMFNGTWSMPGGHLEYGETPAQAGAREAWEETGLIVVEVEPSGHFKPYANSIHKKRHAHYITIYVEFQIVGGELGNPEPEKCDAWEWFDPFTFDQPILEPLPFVKI